jgi:sulfite reductase (NADPH) hemoprotein beta-component
MSDFEQPGTHGRARVSFARTEDIDEFAAVLERFERGEISADEWRTFRLVRGTYGQRQTGDAQMIRVKVPQGWLSPAELEALADVADRYSRGFGHITTRQNLQFHFVALHDVEPAMRRLADAGLTTREACGSSVRNVTACPFAGVSPTEVFDVTPYAEALTRYFLRHPLSGVLPRKFKIAFEGCAEDHIKAAINDIGWQARIDRGRRGFRVLVGGGTATMAASAAVLAEFVPAAEMLELAEAIVRVFHQHGDFVHKARNRMKFLIRSLGWERWRAEVARVRAAVRAEGGVRLPFDPDRPPVEVAPSRSSLSAPSIAEIRARAGAVSTHGPGIHPANVRDGAAAAATLTQWRSTNVSRQKQPGFVTTIVTVPLGDVTSAQLRILGDLSAAFGDGTVRMTATQNVLFRWVRDADLPQLFDRLCAAGLGLAGADTIADVTSCPGAESCKLAVTQSRGLGQAVAAHVRASTDLAAIAPTLDVKISGCPNGCGQHHIAAIGFQGSLRRVKGRALPQYFVTLGGGVDADTARFGRIAAKVPARRVPSALERLARLFAAERSGDETATAFFTRIDAARVTALLADLAAFDETHADAMDFIDFAETAPFRPEMQEGECSA